MPLRHLVRPPQLQKLRYRADHFNGGGSAINLGNRDLHSLLRLVDPITFRDERALDGIIEANAPILAARDALVRQEGPAAVLELLDRAARHSLLEGTRQLPRLREEIARRAGNLGPDRRADLAARLESVNLLANVVNRTRRRDVEELRVERRVSARPARMAPLEREVYERTTEAVQDFALSRGLPLGFLTVMPQRMLASCLPAAMAHWAGGEGLDGYEDEDDAEGDEEPGALRRELGRLAARLADAGELERQDSKFAEFLQALTLHQTERPGDKVVVFSTFRATLAYLHRRLRDAAIASAVMDGRSEGRTALVECFRTDPSLPVLLSSEVGSEGIDLQFAATVFNYDLPWNPMRVEQRIGRVDRLGQEAEAVTVVNFLHADTIDERIWVRLYRRLGLCETALGGFEEILGQRIAEVTRDLLSGRLSEAEKEARIDRVAQAIANQRAHEAELEREAASLIAHGDYVLREIRAKRDEQRLVSEDDIVEYLRLGLNLLHPGCDLAHDRAADRLELRLMPEARVALEGWARVNAVDPEPLVRTTGAREFRLGKATPRNRRPRMGQSHPLVRTSRRAWAKTGA